MCFKKCCKKKFHHKSSPTNGGAYSPSNYPAQAPKNGGLKQESPFPGVYFQGRAVSFREGNGDESHGIKSKDKHHKQLIHGLIFSCANYDLIETQKKTRPDTIHKILAV